MSRRVHVLSVLKHHSSKTYTRNMSIEVRTCASALDGVDQPDVPVVLPPSLMYRQSYPPAWCTGSSTPQPDIPAVLPPSLMYQQSYPRRNFSDIRWTRKCADPKDLVTVWRCGRGQVETAIDMAPCNLAVQLTAGHFTARNTLAANFNYLIRLQAFRNCNKKAQWNTQTRSRNQCCRPEAISTTHYECVSLFLP